MNRIDDYLRLFLLRSASVLVMVYVLTGFAVFAETRGFTDWTGSIRWTLPVMLVFVASYSYALLPIYRNDTRQVRWLLWAQALLLVVLHGMEEMGTLLSFIAFWIARTPNSYELRTCSRLAAGALAFYLAFYFWRDTANTELLILAVLSPAICFFVLSISYSAVNLQQQRMKALALNRELQAAQLLLAQSSRAGERLRIAREMHDLLGHQMTALILNLEVATHKVNGAGLEQIERALALARMLLSDLRNAVSDLRENPALDFDTALAELLGNVPGLRVTLERESGLAIHDPQTAEVLLRCIQEALTNTLRHARAGACHIKLSAHNGQLLLDFSDDGSSTHEIRPGNGLRGMRERIEALAGSLHWHNRGGSLLLQATLPVQDSSA